MAIVSSTDESHPFSTIFVSIEEAKRHLEKAQKTIENVLVDLSITGGEEEYRQFLVNLYGKITMAKWTSQKCILQELTAMNHYEVNLLRGE